MIRFNENEYKEGISYTLASRSAAEYAADMLAKEGYENVFLTAVGGSTVPMMAVEAYAKQMTRMPIFVEQAAELRVRGNQNLTEKSIVVTLSKTGDTKETVAIAKACKKKGCRVVAITKSKNSPLAKSSDYWIPMMHENGVEFEYMLLYWFVFRLMHLRGDFVDYPKFAKQLEVLPQNLLCIKKEFDPIADVIAKTYWNEPYSIWVGGNEMWGEVYMFTMCILEEMQWVRIKAVSSSEFFHGTLELVTPETPVFLVKGEGKCRELDDRVERFLEEFGEKIVIIDPAQYELIGIDDCYRSFVAPLITSTMLVDRLAAHYEKYTGHDLDYRRYYRKFEY